MEFKDTKQLRATLQQFGFPLREENPKKKNVVVILVDKKKMGGDRTTVLKLLAKKLGGKFSTAGSSSAGCVKFNKNFVVEAKDFKMNIKKPGSVSVNADAQPNPGAANEKYLCDIIRKYIKKEGTLDISFEDPDGRVLYIEKGTDVVEDAKQVGADTAGRKKADVLLFTQTNKRIPISLKMATAGKWESADAFWGENARFYFEKAVKEKKVVLKNLGKDPMGRAPGGFVELVAPKAIAIKATRKEIEAVVFGSDLLRDKGGVIKATFTDKDFIYDGASNVLHIKVKKVISSMDEVDKSVEPWFQIKNSKKRLFAKHYRGLRIECFSGAKEIAAATLRMERDPHEPGANYSPGKEKEQ